MMPPLPRAPRLVIFDLDGTLTDSMGPIADTLGEVILEVAGEAVPEAALRQTLGQNLEDTVVKLLPNGCRTTATRVTDRYRTVCYERGLARAAPLFPGARAVLDALRDRGLWLAVATGKSRRGLEATFGTHDLAAHFMTVRTADDTRAKPHPDMLEEILEELGVYADEALMIGDTTFDMLMARSAGVTPLAVTTGLHTQEALEEAGAHHAFPCLETLGRALL